jgi:hypothetical protein
MAAGCIKMSAGLSLFKNHGVASEIFLRPATTFHAIFATLYAIGYGPIEAMRRTRCLVE